MNKLTTKEWITHEGFTKITSIEDIKELTTSKPRVFRLLLNFSVFSRRTIKYFPKKQCFSIKNHVSDTRSTYTEHQLSEDIIAEGIRLGSFWMEPEN